LIYDRVYMFGSVSLCFCCVFVIFRGNFAKQIINDKNSKKKKYTN